MSFCKSINRRRLMSTLLVTLGAIGVDSIGTRTAYPFEGTPRSASTTSAKLNHSVDLNTAVESLPDGDGDVRASALQRTGVETSGETNAQEYSGMQDDGAATTDRVETHEYLPPRSSSSHGFRGGAKTLPAADRSSPWYANGLGALAVVLGAIGGVYFLVRKYVPGSGRPECKNVTVLGRVALGPKHQAVLVKLGSRAILIGLGGDQLTTLAEITDQDEVAKLSRGGGSAVAGQSSEFDSWLRREEEGYKVLEDAEAEMSNPTTASRAPRRSPMGDLLGKLRSFQKTSSRR